MSTRLVFVLVWVLSLGLSHSIRHTDKISLATLAHKRCVFAFRFTGTVEAVKADFRYKLILKHLPDLEDFNFNVHLGVLDQKGKALFEKLHKLDDPLIKTRMVETFLAYKEIDLKNGYREDPGSGRYRASADLTVKSAHSHLYYYWCDLDGFIRHFAKNKAVQLTRSSDNSDHPSFLLKAIDAGTLEFEATVASTKDDKSSLWERLDSHAHFSREDYETLYICSIAATAYAVLIIFVGKKVWGYYNQNEQLDFPLILILASCALQFMGSAVKCLQLLIFSFLDYQLTFLTIFSLIWHMGADTAISLLFITMAKGFGTISREILVDSDWEFAVGFFLLLGRYLWTLAGFFVDFGGQDHYHIYDGLIGWCELGLTILFFAWFSWSIKKSEIYQNSKYTPLRTILVSFGLIHFLLRPVLIIMVNFFDPIHRHSMALIFGFSSHFIVCGLAGITFTNKRGTYMKYSIANGIELIGLGKTL